MNYLTAKETRVEKAWGKKGLVGLRSELLQKVEDKTFFKMEDTDFVMAVCVTVYNQLPKREWKHADAYITETCGLAGLDMREVDWSSLLMQVRLSEETIREDVGDE